MDVDTVKCRICWEVKETKGCVNLTTKWGTGSLKSIKDVILLCVPWMSIKDNSYLCRPCLWQLKFTYAFIERCLKTENILNEENNLDTVSLEEIFENTLRKGNKIQIIFENPANPQPLADIEVIAENTDDVATDVVATDDAAAANDADDAAAAADDDDDVIDLESVLESDSDVEHLRIKTRNYDAAIPLEHDYCIKKGALIHVDIINSQENNTTKSQQCNNMPIQNISSQQEKENVITIDDEVDNNDSDIFNDSTAQCNAVTNNSNFGGTNILQSYLTSKKKTRRSKTILTKRNCKPDIISKTSDPEQVKLDNELKDLLDMAPADIRFIVAHSEMSAEQQDKLVSDGVNILNISKDPSKRKRTIYLTRDYYPISTQCHRCKVPLITRCDYQDHHNMHKRGKINTPGEPIYTCKFCSETFTWDIDLRGHTKYHHGVSSPHYCPKCNKRYKTFKMLNDHMKQFQDQDKCVFSCKRCNKEFSKKYSLAQHEKDVADAPVCDYKKCKVCFEKFTKDDFKIHSTEVHPNCLCPECGKSFSENHLLSVHLKHVHNGEQSMCHQCGKIFVHPRSLEHHMETIHGNRKYICDKCPREFACQVYLKKHMIKHINEDKDISERKKWPCAHCEKAYVKKESLRLHEKTFHLMLDEDKFKCPICNEGHIRKDYLNRHIRSHEKYAKNTCTVCKKSFGTDWRLEYHMFAGHDENGKSLETGENRLQRPPSYKKKKPPKNSGFKSVCKICNKVLANKQTLLIHYKAHLNIRRVKCDICGVMFQGNLALKNHRKLHEDPKFQFSCNICHAYKSSSIELDNHIREVHKNKKYKCNLCHEEFGRRYLLSSHETIAHSEDIAKKEALYAMLQQDEILIPQEVAKDRSSNSKKVAKLSDHGDIDSVLNTLRNKDNVPGGSQERTSVGDYYKKIFLNHVTGDGQHNMSGNDCQSTEDEKACRILEEENDELYISYRD